MFIEEVLELVELKPLKQALVRLPGGNCISTEQLKRVANAIEHVPVDASIVFMDDLNLSLHARATTIIMRIVDTERKVVCNIHQPRIDIFKASELRGGQELYHGQFGHHSFHLIKFFKSIEGIVKVKDGYNQATCMLKITTSGEEMALVAVFIIGYKNLELYSRRNKAQIIEAFFTQSIACLWKLFWSYWHSPPYFAVRFLFIVLTMLWDLDSKTKKQQDLFHAMGSMFAGVLFLAIQISSYVQPIVAVEGNHNGKREMVVPSEQHPIAFDDIIYCLDLPQEMKNQCVLEDKLVLFKGVSGAFKPGVLKTLIFLGGGITTTLMDVLASMKACGYIEGNFTISGYPNKQEIFAQISRYCEQYDIHSPYVIVYVSLIYSAWLHLSSKVDSATRKKMFIVEVLELVVLKPLKQALVRLPGGNCISTEQLKRVANAIELVAVNVSIVLWDDTNLSLHARATTIIIRIVDTGRTVGCNIHQPRIDIFKASEVLFLMKRGGQELYLGQFGHHSFHLIKFFKSIEGILKIKDGYNRATCMLKIATSGEEIALVAVFTIGYQNLELYRLKLVLVCAICIWRKKARIIAAFFTQFIACLWKLCWSYWHSPPYFAVRFLFVVLTIFWDLDSKTKKQQDLFHAVGSMFVGVLFLGIQISSYVQPVVAVGSNHNGKGEMVHPFKRHSITFDDIIYSIEMPQEVNNKGVLKDKLVLLMDVNGSFGPSVLTVMLVVGGASKTTLMNVVIGMKTSGEILGNIKTVGYSKKCETFAQISGDYEQKCIYSTHFSTHESLLYSAWLHLYSEVASAMRKVGI